MSDRYPCHFSSTALMSVMASIQAVVYALCTEKDWSQWKLGWNIRLLTVVYTVSYQWFEPIECQHYGYAFACVLILGLLVLVRE